MPPSPAAQIRRLEIAAAGHNAATRRVAPGRTPTGGDIVPGTRRAARLEENVAALDVTLTEDDLARLEPLGEQVVGARY